MKKFFIFFVLVINALIIKAQCVADAGADAAIQCSDTAVLSVNALLNKAVSNTTEILTSVQFPTPDIGYVVGTAGTILKTVDGGTTWQSHNFLPSESWASVFFTSVNVGFISSGTGKIYKTTDGGNNWTNIFTSQPGKSLRGIKFTDENHGYILGTGGTFMKTINGGATWTAKQTGVTEDLQNLDFINEMTGYIVGDNGTLLKTTDGGNSWVVLDSGIAGLDLYDLDFINENTGYIAGDGLCILKTTNGGATWEVLMHMKDKGGFLHRACQFVDENRGYFGGNWGAIVTTNDSGSTWSYLTSPDFNQPVWDLCCPDNQTIIIVGSGGSIFTYHVPVSYQWEPSNGLVTTNTQTVLASPHETTQYIASITTSNGCIARDTVVVSLVPPEVPPQLCMVTVETNSNFNKVIWEKASLPPADTVFIYKEGSVLNEYEKIEALPVEALSEFVDSLSNALVQSNRYAISTRNLCAIESDKSSSHKTMHLSINQGVGNSWNLIWEPYEGFEVNTYNVYRSISRSDFELIASLSGINTQYTDLEAPSGSVFYKVEAVSDYPCNPLKSYNSSVSNIASHILSNNNIPSLCVVTVDTTVNLNKLAWNLANTGEVDSVIIYRESISNAEYTRIGAVGASQTAEFMDNSSDPLYQCERYKMTSIDRNGLESDRSPAHRSIYLSITEGTNLSWQLNWNEYEGFTVDHYNIYRGGTISDLQMIAILSGGNSQYTDLLPPSGNVFYMVEATGSTDCDLKYIETSSFSNVARHAPDGIGDSEEFAQLSVSPNPVKAEFNLTIKQQVAKVNIEVLDALGAKRKEFVYQKNAHYNLSEFPAGVYYLRITADDRVKYMKVIKL